MPPLGSALRSPDSRVQGDDPRCAPSFSARKLPHRLAPGTELCSAPARREGEAIDIPPGGSIRILDVDQNPADSPSASFSNLADRGTWGVLSGPWEIC